MAASRSSSMGPLQVCGWYPSRRAAGGGTVVTKCTAHTIVITGAGKQGVDFLGRACAPPCRSSSTRRTGGGKARRR